MKLFTYTLLADGSSDRALLPIIDWLITQTLPSQNVVRNFAQGSFLPRAPLAARIQSAIKYFPCDLLIVHRDAEGVDFDERITEIEQAGLHCALPIVPLVPLRMTEAWMFSDERAIRTAAENRSSRHPLNVPGRRQWESINDPKQVLFELLKMASGKTGRGLKQFNVERARTVLTGFTEDFGGLRGQSSFDAFERSLVQHLNRYALD